MRQGTAALCLACVLSLPLAAQQKSAADDGRPSAPAVQTGNSELGTHKSFRFTTLGDAIGPKATETSYSGAGAKQAETAPPGTPPPPASAGAAAPSPMVQLVEPGGGPQTGPPATITLQDAIARARKNYAQYLAAVTDAKIANQDRLQARDALLPSFS